MTEKKEWRFVVGNPSFPTAGEVTAMLLAAAENHRELQESHYQAWGRVQVAELNATQREIEAKSGAYTRGDVDGKNAEHRAIQLDAAVLNDRLRRKAQEWLHEAQRALKLIEVALESARVHRGALHDIARLRMAETLAEANRGLGALYSWGQS